MRAPSLNQYALGMGLCIFSAVGFASKTILAKLCYSFGMPLVPVLALRMFFAGIIFFTVTIYNIRTGHWSFAFSLKEICAALILGIFGYYLSAVLDFSGLLYVDAGLGRMILFLYPTIVVLINAALTHVKVDRSSWLSLALCYGGILLMMSGSLQNALDSKNIYLGAALIFAAAIVYASYIVALDRLLHQFEALRFTTFILCIACISSFVHFFTSQNITEITALPARGVFYCFLMGLFSTVMPIYALSGGIARIGAAKSAMLSMIGPVITLIMGFIFLNEKFGITAVCGVACILLGVWRIGRCKI